MKGMSKCYQIWGVLLYLCCYVEAKPASKVYTLISPPALDFEGIIDSLVLH